MRELIRELVSFLSMDPLLVGDVVARVGTIAGDPGIPMPLEINSSLPHIQSAWLGRYPESGLPYVLSLKPAQEVHITPGELEELLGKFYPVATDRGNPKQVIFYPKKEGTSWSIVVIADLETGSASIETARISNIRFRRDRLKIPQSMAN